MLKVVADQLVIKKYNRQFIKKFKPFVDEQIKVRLGHQGASFKAKVLWSKHLQTWMFSHAVDKIRYWNAFGTSKPQAGELLPITSEINFPWSGIDRKTGAAFAEDARGNVYVIHRGKIGGGKKGIGKSFFEQSYHGVWSWMEDGDCLTQVAVIGALSSPRLALQIALFVKKIELLKLAAIPSPQTEINFPDTTFRPELVGSLPALEKTSLAASCDHDLVVSNLAALLQCWKCKIGNDSSCELFLMEPAQGKKSHIFAVLTDITEKNVLAAAAKLLLQTTPGDNTPFPLLIMPEGETGNYVHMLQKLGISVTGFCLEDNRIIFPGLSKIRLDQNRQLWK